MTYETGTSTDIGDLVDVKLKAFMQAEGWNLNDDNWPNHLALSKGGCYLSLREFTTNFNDVFSVNRDDHRIRAHLASSYDGSQGTPDLRYQNQPDALVQNLGTEPWVQLNDLVGPFTSYHLFSGAIGERDYIIMVVEMAAGHFGHMAFGMIDDLGFGFDPPIAFLIGTYYNWWPENVTEASDSMVRWNATDHWTPFSTTNAIHVYSEGAEPTRKMSNSQVGVLYNKLIVSSDERMLDHVAISGPNSLNGVTPLYPFHIMNSLVSSAAHHGYYGELPNVRYCSLKGRSPKEEITIGSDTWILFPMRFQYHLDIIPRPASPGLANCSYQAGLAVKKIV